MHSVTPRGLGGGDDLIHIQIGRRARATQPMGLIGAKDVQPLGIIFRVNSDGGEIQGGGGALNTNGNLAPVGDQQL